MAIIMSWMPSSWCQILGNRILKRQLQKLVNKYRAQIESGRAMELDTYRFIISGESRTGKSMMVQFFLRCLLCKKLNNETLDPCDGTCDSCIEKRYWHGIEGLYSFAATMQNQLEVELKNYDCTKISTPNDIRRILNDLSDLPYGLRIVYFDEAHRLVKNEMADMLLKEVEDLPFFWILATAYPERFEQMFLNRFIKLKTQYPTQAEMRDWLVSRCHEWKIKYELGALVRVAEKSNLIAGTALHALAMASMDPGKGLTQELVEDVWEPALR